jgi:hypothetical protein
MYLGFSIPSTASLKIEHHERVAYMSSLEFTRSCFRHSVGGKTAQNTYRWARRKSFPKYCLLKVRFTPSYVSDTITPRSAARLNNQQINEY